MGDDMNFREQESNLNALRKDDCASPHTHAGAGSEGFGSPAGVDWATEEEIEELCLKNKQ